MIKGNQVLHLPTKHKGLVLIAEAGRSFVMFASGIAPFTWVDNAELIVVDEALPVEAALEEAVATQAAEVRFLREALTEIFEYASDREDIDYNGNANDCMKIAAMVPYSIQREVRERAEARAYIRNITWDQA